MSKTIYSSVRFSPTAKYMLKIITQLDKRNQTQELLWLIERRYKELVDKKTD